MSNREYSELPTESYVLLADGEIRKLSPRKSEKLTDYPTIAPLAVSIAECCRYTSFGRTKVYQLIRDGRLKASRVDRRTLVLMSSIRALIVDSAIDT